MSEKFRNKYRNESTRLKKWDYRRSGQYFITICTKNREHYFGEILDGKIKLSPIGVIADVLWHEIKNHTKNVELGEFVVMPNHIHGILILNNGGSDVGTLHPDVGTLHATSLQTQTQPPQSILKPTNPDNKNETMSRISPKPGSVSTVIRSYKSAVTKHIRRLGFDFKWQSRYHDHIIRNQSEYQRIADYIINNPVKLENDGFFNNQ